MRCETRGSLARQIMRYALPFNAPAGSRWVMALGAYFDESGTNPSDAALSIAGFISDDERWGIFSERWDKALTDWELEPRFWHMADYEARQKQFASWPRDETSEKRFDYLLSLITDYTVASITMTFPRVLYRSYVETKLNPESALYMMTVTFLMLETYIYSQQQRMAGPIALIFEQGARGRHEVETSYNKVPRDTAAHYGFASLTFAPKAKGFEGLQAADILAYEQFRHYPKVYGDESRRVRYPLKKIMHAVPTSGGVIQKENLDEVFRVLGTEL